jgi:hypothetical protein
MDSSDVEWVGWGNKQTYRTNVSIAKSALASMRHCSSNIDRDVRKTVERALDTVAKDETVQLALTASVVFNKATMRTEVVVGAAEGEVASTDNLFAETIETLTKGLCTAATKFTRKLVGGLARAAAEGGQDVANDYIMQRARLRRVNNATEPKAIQRRANVYLHASGASLKHLVKAARARKTMSEPTGTNGDDTLDSSVSWHYKMLHPTNVATIASIDLEDLKDVEDPGAPDLDLLANLVQEQASATENP